MFQNGHSLMLMAGNDQEFDLHWSGSPHGSCITCTWNKTPYVENWKDASSLQ
jgi:hypothetical protein